MLHHHLQILIHRRVLLKNCLLFSNLCQLPKIEKFELEVPGVGILGTGFCFWGSH